jgi:hypothetical protein
MKYKYL